MHLSLAASQSRSPKLICSVSCGTKQKCVHVKNCWNINLFYDMMCTLCSRIKYSYHLCLSVALFVYYYCFWCALPARSRSQCNYCCFVWVTEQPHLNKRQLLMHLTVTLVRWGSHSWLVIFSVCVVSFVVSSPEPNHVLLLPNLKQGRSKGMNGFNEN